MEVEKCRHELVADQRLVDADPDPRVPARTRYPDFLAAQSFNGAYAHPFRHGRQNPDKPGPGVHDASAQNRSPRQFLVDHIELDAHSSMPPTSARLCPHSSRYFERIV